MENPSREPDRAPGPRPAVVPSRTAKPRRNKSTWRLVAIALVLILLAARFWHAKSATHLFGKPQAPPVPTAIVSTGEVDATLRVTGSISALNSVSLLAPRVMGSRSGVNRGGDANLGGGPGGGGGGGGGGGADFNLVLLHLAKPGSRIKSGEIAGQFDPQSQLQRLDDYKDTVVQLENSIRSMAANLASIKEAHDQSVRAAEAALEQARLTLETAPVLSSIDVEKTKLSVEEAAATYKQLQEESALVIASQQAQIRISELNRDQSKIELQRAEANVQRMSVHAPIDGIVVMATIVRNGEMGQIREGDQVNAGQPFMTIVDPSSMVLSGSVNQVDAERLRLGMKCTVHVDAYPELSIPGVVTGIGAMAKASTFRERWVGEIPVRIKIDHTDPRLLPDLSGSADVVLESETNAVVVPVAAVFYENAEPFVWLKSPEGWVKRGVQVGAESYTSVAIHSGLQKGDVVALQTPMQAPM